MTSKQYHQSINRKSDSSWHGTSRRHAKGKSGNSGIVAKNGQIQNVALETIFNRPGWTKWRLV